MRCRPLRFAVALAVVLLPAACGGPPDEAVEPRPAAGVARSPDEGGPRGPVAEEAVDMRPTTAGGDLATFTTAASRADVASFGAEVPILRAVRAGTHDGFDRIVFEFDSQGLPQWHVAYIDGPATDCGSGHEVPLEGGARLQVRFSGAHAHTPAGEPTSGPRRRAIGQPALRELVRTCDFEAEVTWVAGVASRAGYRPRVLSDPSRLVIDVAH